MFRLSVIKRSFGSVALRSKIFAPTKKDSSLGKLEMPRYARLLLKGGYIHQTEQGMYSFLPLGLRVMEEMEKVVDNHLGAIGAQKMQMPIVQSLDRWIKSGRREQIGKELYTLKDRKGQDLCLSPTNEEVITDLVKDLVVVVLMFN